MALNLPVAAGNKTVPAFLGSLTIGGMDYLHFKKIGDPPYAGGAADGEIAYITIPKDFEFVEINYSNNPPTTTPSGQIATLDHQLPILLYERPAGTLLNHRLTPGQQGFCPSTVYPHCGKFACAKATFLMANKNPVLFYYPGQMSFYSEATRTHVNVSLSDYYLTPLFLENQSIIYYAMGKVNAPYLSNWNNQIIAPPFDINQHYVAVDGPMIYSDALGIWVTFEAALR